MWCFCLWGTKQVVEVCWGAIYAFRNEKKKNYWKHTTKLIIMHKLKQSSYQIRCKVHMFALWQTVSGFSHVHAGKCSSTLRGSKDTEKTDGWMWLFQNFNSAMLFFTSTSLEMTDSSNYTYTALMLFAEIKQRWYIELQVPFSCHCLWGEKKYDFFHWR